MVLTLSILTIITLAMGIVGERYYARARRALNDSTANLRVAYAKHLIAQEYHAQALDSFVWLSSHDSQWLRAAPHREPVWFVVVPRGREVEACKLLNANPSTRADVL